MSSDLGIRVGHWTDAAARTGCTVILLPEGTVASAEVRGGAPASRELEVLSPERTVSTVDAAVLTGGSAFGLASADGVMRFLEETGRGTPTPAGRVPIVPTLGLYDLAVGDPRTRPGPDQGYAACRSASQEIEVGAVGAGTGATVGHVRGPSGAAPGGISTATIRKGRLVVTAVVAVNAFGAIDVDGTLADRVVADADPDGIGGPVPFTNTTIGVVTTNARLDKVGCLIAAQGAHDGLSRALAPPHTRFDGDAFIAAATGAVDANVDVVRMLALTTVAQAIRSLA
ncbi:MAG TPA: P1 family peptidase [Stackebrandtia sp.]|jgi:L-aminopeptidase/D-esterase-like protein|uniref:P1 family peptidase n=1 Tax=Stackebrandtia sp. TaxID=2023065 RepID=UPI002D6A153E|nr:P1 family peptidase [Stackebrandtia sp.]HZE40212.1 P1 family peptidase [Stackebrandtia sp.]